MMRFLSSLLFGGMLIGLSACADRPDYDKRAGLSQNDYRSIGGAAALKADPAEPPLPPLHRMIAAPEKPAEEDPRRVTLSITDQTPLRDVLIELARRAGVDLALDPRIRGGIIFSATDRPLKEVIDRLTATAGLRYELTDNVLRVEIDAPYLESYRLDFLNMSRNSESSISASTDVFSSVGGSAAGGNASSSKVSSKSESHLWDEVSQNVEQILSRYPRSDALLNMGAETLPLAPLPATISEGADGGNASGLGAGIARSLTPITDEDEPSAVTAPAEIENDPNKPYFTMNRQAGIVSVYAPQSVQRKIENYLDQVKQSISAQVLIEAKIVEVTLTDEYRSGINWQRLNANDDFKFSVPFGRTQTFPPLSDTPPSMALSFAFDGDADIDALVDLISEFGTVRTLSSPRLTAMNNQVAVLKVAENEVYFSIDIEREDLENGTTRATFTSTMNTVPIGLVMAVQPSIDLADSQVTLGLRPTISRVARRVSDPAVALEAASLNVDVESLIPVVEVREMDSVVTIGSGNVVVMGGLMQERVSRTENGIPGAKDVPLIGNAFKGREDSTAVTELVIFLRATVVADRDSVAPADIDLYRKFAPDPRPVLF